MPNPTPSPVASGPRTVLRTVAATDESEFIRLAQESHELHHPWVSPPSSPEEFAALLSRIGDRYLPLALCDRENGRLLGMLNLSEICMGAFRSAYLGYYAFAPSAGLGLMGEGLALIVATAFEVLDLHRVEANIRPENHASIRLVRRAGFEREGYSRDYLFLDGAWRDHERWALRRETSKPSHGIETHAPETIRGATGT